MPALRPCHVEAPFDGLDDILFENRGQDIVLVLEHVVERLARDVGVLAYVRYGYARVKAFPRPALSGSKLSRSSHPPIVVPSTLLLPLAVDAPPMPRL